VAENPADFLGIRDDGQDLPPGTETRKMPFKLLHLTEGDIEELRTRLFDHYKSFLVNEFSSSPS
jgi:hypothetical protein